MLNELMKWRESWKTVPSLTEEVFEVLQHLQSLRFP